MTLTGTAFLVLVLVVTALAFAAAIVFLPRAAGRRVGPVAARIGMLLAVNLLVLLSATVVLNDQYLFFSDWSDLHNAIFGGGQAATYAAGGAAQQAADAKLPPPGAKDPTGKLKIKGRTIKVTFVGRRSGLKGTVLVSLPAGYTDKANDHQTYPVLETFPGYPGAPSQWPDVMHLPGYLDTAQSQHKIGPAITISPQTEFPGGVDTECTNGPGHDPQVETWLTEDVPAWARGALRVRADRSSWATIGLSAGGWCAAMAAMLHPAQYGAGIVLGGYFSPEFGERYKPFTANSALGRRYDLLAQCAQRPPPVALWVQTSHADPVSYPSTSRLLATARKPLAVQAVVLDHAGHRISVWKNLLPQVLQWLGANISGFAP